MAWGAAKVVERLFNWFTDQNWVWWPFLFFVERPRKTEPFALDLIVNVALIAAIEVTLLAGVIMIMRPDLATLGAATVALVAGALGVIAFVTCGAIVTAAALCWNRRAGRLTGGTEPAGLRKPRGPEYVIKSQLRGVAVVATVAFFQLSYWDIARVFQQAHEEVPSDFGQGAGLFWMLLLFLTAGLAPIMRWSISAAAGFRASLATAYKAAYSGLLLSISVFIAVSLAVVKAAPSIADLPMTATWKAYIAAGLLIAAFLAHAVVATLLRTPDLRRAGMATGAAIAAIYLAICTAIAAALWWAFAYRE